MRSKSILKCSIVLAIGLSMVLTSFSLTLAQAKKRYFSFGGGSSTGVYYFTAGGFSNIIQKYVPGIKMTPISTEATVENINLIDRGKIEFALADTNTLLSMLKEGKGKNFRLIGGGYVSPLQWVVRAESPIKKIEDFRGKKIGVGAVGSGTLVGIKAILESGYGITFNDFKPQMLAFGPMGDAIKDGTIDSAGIPAGLPTPVVTDLATSINIRFIPIEKDAAERIQKTYAYVSCVIPAGTYPNQPNDVHTVAYPNAWGCLAGLPTDLVYEMVKAIYDHPKEVEAVHPSSKEFNFNNIYRGLELVKKYIPYHPGAVKYFKEKKVWKE